MEIVSSAEMRALPSLGGREVAPGAVKAETLLLELSRGEVGWGGAEWALPLPALCPVTCLGEQISFAGSLCSVCHSCTEILKCIMQPAMESQ